jgi:nitrate reductase NapE
MLAAPAQPSRGREIFAFLILAVLIWPVIACGAVGAYGLAFWIYFMLSGPPGPG